MDEIKDTNVNDPDVKIPGEEWGFIDEESNIHQKDGVLFRGRIIGKMRGKDRAAAFEFYTTRFAELEKRFGELEKRIQTDSNKIKYLDLIEKMKERLNEYDALGDFDGLLQRLKNFEQEIATVQEQRKSSKEELCRKAEELSTSTDWKATSEALMALQDEWKKIGNTGKAYEDALWDRFRSAQDKFYDGRRAYLESLEQGYQENRQKKEELCRKAESLSSSTDWKGTHEALLELQDQWKNIGYAGRMHEEDLWQIFRAAQDRFYVKREEHFKGLDQEREQNRARKTELCLKTEALCDSTDWRSTHEELRALQDEWKKIGSAGRDYEEELWQRFKGAQDKFYEKRNQDLFGNMELKEKLIDTVESLIYSTNIKDAKEKVKELQNEWKNIGPVPREHSDELWDRFRSACDEIFGRSREEYKRKQTDWKNGVQEAIERKRDQIKNLRGSITYDEDLIKRWRYNISGLYFSDKAEEILSSLETKIGAVEEKIQSKKDRITELENSIRDMEKKLRTES
jgi:hypothetical protein